MLTREIICLDCFRNLIMSWMFKAPAVIMKVIISWLFKDPIITVTWLNFNRAQSNSKKKWVIRMCHFQAQKGPFVLNKIFRYKPVLLLSSTCWPFSLCKIYKKFLQSIQSCEDAPFLDPKWSICPKHFLGGKLLISFSSNY